MGTINQFVIDGNVTRDVGLRHTPRGTAVATYTIAVDNVFYEGDQKREETDYVPVTTYGRQAENDAKYLKKGSGVTVIGRIRSWYRPDEKKGGFNFEAMTVKYQSKPSSTPKSVEKAPDEEWLRDYAAEEDRAGGGEQGKAPFRKGS